MGAADMKRDLEIVRGTSALLVAHLHGCTAEAALAAVDRAVAERRGVQMTGEAIFEMAEAASMDIYQQIEHEAEHAQQSEEGHHP